MMKLPLEGLRLDLLVNDEVIIELKAVEIVNPVWEAQIISHFKTHRKTVRLFNQLQCSLDKARG